MIWKWSEIFRSNQISSFFQNAIWSDLRSLFNLMILIWSQIRILMIFQYSGVTLPTLITIHYFLTLSCLDGLDESLSRAGKGAPRPKILRTRSLSERCKFMPEPKTWKILTKHKYKMLFPWNQFHEKIF